MNSLAGFSLIELMIALFIGSILLITGIPYLHSAYTNFQTTKDINHLIGAIQVARSAAVFNRYPVTFCSLSEDNRCIGKWSALTIYADYNQNGSVDQDDKILYQLDRTQINSSLSWSAFGANEFLRKRMIQLVPSGALNNQNGSLYYCVKDRPQLSRRIIINKQARTRVVQLKDYDQRCMF